MIAIDFDCPWTHPTCVIAILLNSILNLRSIYNFKKIVHISGAPPPPHLAVFRCRSRT